MKDENYVENENFAKQKRKFYLKKSILIKRTCPGKAKFFAYKFFFNIVLYIVTFLIAKIPPLKFTSSTNNFNIIKLRNVT